LEEPLGVATTPGVLYSTNPQQALAEDGRYVLKGPLLPVVFAESVCYELANRVGLVVPPHGVCFPSEDGTPWFATKMLEHRLPVDDLYRSGRVSNPDVLADAAVFDIWTCNVDRNINNLVGSTDQSYRPPRVRLYAIDFERAEAVRGNMNRFEITAIAPQRFMPREALAEIVRGFSPPQAIAQRIQDVSDDDLHGVIDQVIASLNFPSVPWRSMTEGLLAQRRNRLAQLVQEAWS